MSRFKLSSFPLLYFVTTFDICDSKLMYPVEYYKIVVETNKFWIDIRKKKVKDDDDDDSEILRLKEVLKWKEIDEFLIEKICKIGPPQGSNQDENDDENN